MAAAEQKHNFCYPVRVLENERVKLVPFDVDKHGDALFDAAAPDATRLCHYLPFGPFASAAEAKEYYTARLDPAPSVFLYAVLVKSPTDGAEELGGAIGYLLSEPAHLSTEIGFVFTLPKFQRTHVTKNAVGLLLCNALDPPARGGLGLRRVQWQAHGSNAASQALARRMGFTYEGLIRWQRVLPEGKESSADVAALGAGPGGEEQRPGRHSAMLSFCWDDWLEKRADVIALMEK